MKGEAEEPAGHPLMPSPLVFEPGNLGKSVCNHDVFITGWFVVLPLDSRLAVRWEPRIEYGLDYTQDRELIGVCPLSGNPSGPPCENQSEPLSENPSEPLAGVLKDPLRRIRGHEVGKCMEAAHGGRSCKLLEPLSDYYIVIVNFDTTKEDVEAICDESGVEVSRCCHWEIVQGQETDRPIQRCPEGPRDAVLVQHNYLALQSLL